MKFRKNDMGWSIKSKHLWIDRSYKTERSAESFSVDVYAFGYRVRWIPTYKFFSIQNMRDWERA